MVKTTQKEIRAAQVAHALAAAVRANEAEAADVLRILRHELRRRNTGKGEMIATRSLEAQRVIDEYNASGQARPRNGSPDALHADHVWPLTEEHLRTVMSVEGWVRELRHLSTVVCVTAAENYRLQKIEKTTPGPEKYAIANVQFTSADTPWSAQSSPSA